MVDEQTGAERSGAHEALDDDTLRLLHRTIAGVSDDYTNLRNNTAAAKLIEYTNHLTKQGVTARAALEPLVLMVAPLAPHLAEELWQRLGHDTSLAHGPFPVADPQYLVEDTVELPVQVNGKVRGRITVAADADADALEAAALADAKVQEFLGGATPKKVIVVAGRLVNIVAVVGDHTETPNHRWRTMTSWMWASRGALTASAMTLATVSGLRNCAGVVLAALVGDQPLLHFGGDPARVHRGHPQRRLVVAQ